MAPEGRSPPLILPPGGPRTTKKRKRVKRISFEDFDGEDDPLDQKSQGSLSQVATAQDRPSAFNHDPVSLVSRDAEKVETQERSHEGQGNGTSEPGHVKPLENGAPVPVQVSATNGSGPRYIEKTESQSMETANSTLVHSDSPHRLSETHAMADSTHESAEGTESDSSYVTAWEEEHQDRKEGNKAYNSAVASPPAIRVQQPTPTIAPARIAQYLDSILPKDPRFLTIPVENRQGFRGIAADQNTTGRGDAEPSNDDFEAAIGAFTRQNVTGAGKLTNTTDGVRASAGKPVKNAPRQKLNGTVHEPRHNQDSRGSSESTSEQSAYNIGDQPAPDQAIGASARLTSGENITSTEENANELPTENIRPTPQNLRYGTYPSQQGPQNRNPPLGSSRLQNTTKLGAYKLKSPELLCRLLTVAELFRQRDNNLGPGSTNERWIS